MGAKNYRKKQFKRLLLMLNNIIEYEHLQSHELERMGRKHVIGFWRRHESLSDKTRKEYWQILSVLFQKLGKHSPPKPKLIVQFKNERVNEKN